MSLFGRKEKEEIARLKEQMLPEQIELADLNGQIEQQRKMLEDLRQKCEKAQAQLQKARDQIIETDEAAMLQSFGFFVPHYLYRTSDEYKAAITAVRDKQKDMVKAKQAVSGTKNWTVNGNASQGRKMVSDMQKLLLRAFNAECDDAIDHVKFNNFASCEKKIQASSEAIGKLGQMMEVRISHQYVNLKIQELQLMYEYQLKKQEEKDAQRAAREKMREEAKLAKEIEEARKRLEKEQTHYRNALEQINSRLNKGDLEDPDAFLAKKKELEEQLARIDQEFREVDYREANQRAGYVYIISNIGAFGPDVYKIGMTRRLDQMDRIDELGDASVPFDFDVHAMIFTEDAPGLEAALHNAFADRKLNFINTRREFFRVSLDEIKQVIKQNFDKAVEFVDVPPAEQYRETLAIKEAQNKAQ